jgi:hypothetical protein
VALVNECYRLAQKQSFSVLSRILSDGSSFSAQQVTTLFTECYDEALGSFLFSILMSASSSDELREDRNRTLLAFLVRKRHSAAIAITAEALTKGSPLKGTPVGTAKTFAAAVSALLDERSHSIWQSFFELTKSDQELAKEVIEELAQSLRFEAGNFGGDHAESDVADLIIWLFQTYADQDEDRSGRARWVSSADQVEHFRSDLLRSLVGRGTKESVAAVAKIASSISDRPWLRADPGSS